MGGNTLIPPSSSAGQFPVNSGGRFFFFINVTDADVTSRQTSVTRLPYVYTRNGLKQYASQGLQFGDNRTPDDRLVIGQDYYQQTGEVGADIGAEGRDPYAWLFHPYFYNGTSGEAFKEITRIKVLGAKMLN